MPGLVAAADELIDAVTELHGWALGRADRAAPRQPASRRRCEAALDDELIAALLLAHGMHPEPLGRARRAGAGGVLRRRSAEHAGRIELVEAVEAEARVRLAISGGDAQQRWRTRLTVERALRELVADVVELQIDGAERRAGAGTPSTRRSSRSRRSGGAGRRAGPSSRRLAALAPGDVVQLVHDGRALVACRSATTSSSPPTRSRPTRCASSPPTRRRRGRRRLAAGARRPVPDPRRRRRRRGVAVSAPAGRAAGRRRAWDRTATR